MFLTVWECGCVLAVWSAGVFLAVWEGGFLGVRVCSALCGCVGVLGDPSGVIAGHL